LHVEPFAEEHEQGHDDADSEKRFPERL
jgi:hypothetical protein